MANLKQFRLPDLGEGLTEGEILRWLVRPGDTVRLNQPIVEVETAKAAVEVPSPYAGVVTELLHAEGETVDVGSPIITFDTGPGGPAAIGDRTPGMSDMIPAALVAPPAGARRCWSGTGRGRRWLGGGRGARGRALTGRRWPASHCGSPERRSAR